MLFILFGYDNHTHSENVILYHILFPYLDPSHKSSKYTFFFQSKNYMKLMEHCKN